MAEDKRLSTEEAAAYLRYHAGTIENWRREFPYRGPRYCKPHGRVFYYQSDLDDWLKNGTRPETKGSTS